MAGRNSCFPEKLTAEITSFKTCFSEDSSIFREFAPIYSALQKTGNSEKFYATFYGKIVWHAETFFPTLSEHASTFLSTKLADYTVAQYKKGSLSQRHDKEQTAPPFTDTERNAMHYLGGYVYHNLHRKLKNSKQYKTAQSQQCIAILEAAKEEESTNDTKNLNLVSVVSNLLGSIIKLYIRVRAFSHAKNLIQKFKVDKSQTKAKALRKEISRSLESDTQ